MPSDVGNAWDAINCEFALGGVCQVWIWTQLGESERKEDEYYLWYLWAMA